MTKLKMKQLYLMPNEDNHIYANANEKHKTHKKRCTKKYLKTKAHPFKQTTSIIKKVNISLFPQEADISNDTKKHQK
jgi:hypothetical protein